MKMIDPKFEKFAFEKLGLVTARDTDGNYIEPETSRAWAVWQEAARANSGSGRCPMCNGNDACAPCAYPSKGKPGCLRDARIAALGSQVHPSMGAPSRTAGEWSDAPLLARFGAKRIQADGKINVCFNPLDLAALLAYTLRAATCGPLAGWTPASNPPDADTTVMLALADGEVWQGYWDGGDWIEVSGLRLAPGRVTYWQHTPKHPEDRS